MSKNRKGYVMDMMDKNRSYLDVIRAFSTIVIVCFHYSCGLVKYHFSGFTNYFYHYANNYWGTLGVNLFFLLSGAGLWLGYSRSCVPGTYYKRRWLKIFPMFYLCMIPLYVINALFVEKDFFYGGSPVKILLTLAGMDGYLRSVMNNYYLIGEWFLGVIIILYIMFPLLRKLLLSKAAVPVTALLFVLCCIDGQVGFSLITGRGWLGYYLFVFWLGMLFMKYEEILLRYVKWYYCLLPVIALLFIKLPVPWKNDMLSIVLGICMLALFMSLSSMERQPVFFLKFCKITAGYSYAIFLVHHVIIDLFFKACFPMIHNRNALAFLLLLGMIIFVCAVVLDRMEKAVRKRVKAPSFLKSRLR